VLAGLVLTLLSQSTSLDKLKVPLIEAHTSAGRVEAMGQIPMPSKSGDLFLKAAWIWLASGEKAVTQFRKTFNLAEKPSKAIVDITSEASYQLFVNGQLVSRGPADVGRDFDTGALGPWLFDRRDLTAYFHKGINTVAVQVFPEALVFSESTTNQPGLCLKARLSTGNEKLAIQTDASWKASVDPMVGYFKVPQGESMAGSDVLQFDAREERLGWTQAGFDDSDWPAATLVSHSLTPSLLSGLPPLLETPYPVKTVERIHGGVNKDLEVRATGGFAVHFDRVLSAYAGLKITGTAGTVVSVMPNELNQPGWSRPFRAVLRDGEQVIQSPMLDSFSTLNIEFDHVTGPAKVEEVRALFSSYPVTYQGEFACSDPKLTEIWHVGRWATQICMQTHHLDSPNHNEPICDPGDYLIETLINYQTFGVSALAKQDLEKYGRVLNARKNRPFHTSYALLWIQMLVEYYRYTGDLELVKSLAPTVYSLLESWHGWIGKNGLISEAPNYMFMDWIELEGFNLHHPPAVIGQGYMTALYFQALKDQALIAAALGDDRRVQQAQSEQTKVREAFLRELWVSEQGSLTDGLFRDGKPFQSSVQPSEWLPADKDIETFTTQVNTFAVTCGLVPTDQGQAIMRRILARPDMKCQPYFMHFVFDALDAAGIYNEFATKQMRRWTVIPATQSFREMWHDGDYSHAWGATSTYQLSRRILGIEPVEPGFKTVQIRIHPCDLTWAKGTVPTPHGPVTVAWEKDSLGNFKVQIRLPKNTTGYFISPIDGKESDIKGSVSFSLKAGG
jgi:hypothetical protein